MSVLIVEDEEKLRSYLKKILSAEGFETFIAESYSSGSEWLDDDLHDIELVILDRMLGDGDGIELLKKWKKKRSQTAILILSALGSSDEKARILDLGADDYLAKPFSTFELIARCRSLLRRKPMAQQPATVRILGNTSVDLLSHRIFVGEVPIDLSNKEYRVLSLLSEKIQRVFTKYELFDRVWEAGYDIESNVVEVTIKNLRRKLIDSQSDIKIISKRNIGYWIEI